MFARKDYLDDKCSHDEYYRQFVTEGVMWAVRSVISVDRLKASRDEHMNDIPLNVWDRVFPKCPAAVNQAMRDGGDYPTAAGLVCLGKAAARMLLEQEDQCSKSS